jgi:hypothetical protein
MAFDNFGITTKGFEMLAAATTGSLIQMVGGRCSQNTISQANIPSATDSQFLSAPDGTVKAMSVTDTAAQIIIEFSNAGLQNAITIKSFCVRAMSQGSATAYPFAVCSLNNGGITLQPQSVTGVVVRFQVPFDLTFDGASTYIEGIPVGNNASVDMLDRFVSAHSLGDSTTGDAQTIRGEKTFKNSTYFNDDIFSTHNASGVPLCNLGNTADRFNAINGNFGNFVFVSAIKPDDPDDPEYGQETRVGADYAPFDHVYAAKLHGVIPYTDLDTSVEIPIGAIVVLTGLSSNLGVGYGVRGVYTLGTLNGGIDPQGHQTSSSQEYTLLTATTANITYALAMRRS